MQKKIVAACDGEFERDFPLPSSEPEKITEKGTEGNDYEGTLRIYSQNGTVLAGSVYSSDPYVSVEESTFYGADVRIPYTAHIAGFYPGEKIEGRFTIVTDGYETYVPYEFIVEEKPVFAGAKRIDDLGSFADYYMKEPADALAAFSSEEFQKFLIRHNYDKYLSYRALTSTMGYTRLSLESFLTANGYKDAIRIHVFPENLSFYSISADVKETFRITRNTDGYIKLHFAVPEDSFIDIEKTDASDTDFYGGTLEIPFFIRKDRLHEGINRTELTVSENGFSVTKTITASTYGRGEKVHAKHREKKQVILAAMNTYLDFRLRKSDAKSFLKSATDASEYFLNENPSDYFALCYRTMAQIVAGEKKQALVTISMLKGMIEDKTSFEWAFLLYLCTLLEPDDDYIDRITAEIEQIQTEHPDDARIFWFLMFLRRRYMDAPFERLRDLRQWIIRGVSSPVFYAEALDMLNAYPYMIGQLDSFSLSILRFGIRHDAINKSIIPSVCECIYDRKDYSESVYEFISDLYQKFMDPTLLEAIVSYLLRTRCIGHKYLVWYKRGVETGLNLTGLYESYIYSVTDDDTEVLPRMLVMYFAYENNLPEDRKEFIYANVVTYREKRPSVYEAYLKQIERYAIEKLQAGKINDNLAIVYEDLYKRGFFDKDMLGELRQLKNCVKIICMSQESGELYIFTEKEKDPLKVLLSDHSAVIDISEDTFFTVLVSPDGTYFEKEDFYTEKMLPGIDIEKTDDKSQDRQIIYAMSEEADRGYRMRFFIDIDKETLRNAAPVLSEDAYEPSAFKNLPDKEAAYIVRNLIMQGRMDEAYSAIKVINGLNVPDNQLLGLVTSISDGNDKKDPFLLSLAAYLLRNLLSNADTLGYLCQYYNGPTEEMITLFRYANARECDVRGLCERIIEQMIYEEGDDPAIKAVFDTYRDAGGDKDIITAYLSYFSDRYVLDRPQETDGKFFEEIKDRLERKEAVNQSMKTALLKYYASNGVSDDDLHIAEDLLNENLLAGRYFAFYKKLGLGLIVRSGIYEKTIIEYRGEAGGSYTITINPGENEISDEMNEVYDGIYTYTFILFRGESAEYQITDTKGVVKKESSVTNQDYLDEIADSRFGRIGTIYEDVKGRKEELKKDVDDYLRLDISAKDLFSMV